MEILILKIEFESLKLLDIFKEKVEDYVKGNYIIAFKADSDLLESI